MRTSCTAEVLSTTLPQSLGADWFASLRAVPRAIPMSTGHHRLTDGSLLRIDIEMGRWVGRLYTPQLRVKTQITGSDAEVHAWADKITA